MSFEIRDGTFPQLVKRLGGTLLPPSGDCEVGRARVSVGDATVLLIAYDRSGSAWRHGYRGSRPDQTVAVRGAPPARCHELEALLFKSHDLQDLLPRARGGSGSREVATSKGRRRGEG